MIENQLDCVLVPFVHFDTSGRADRTVVGGTLPREPSEEPVPTPGVYHKLEFLFPNLCQNHIAEKLRGGYNLFQGDLPIGEYRKRRQDLLDRVKA
jgi:hypothetical protein